MKPHKMVEMLSDTFYNVSCGIKFAPMRKAKETIYVSLRLNVNRGLI